MKQKHKKMAYISLASAIVACTSIIAAIVTGIYVQNVGMIDTFRSITIPFGIISIFTGVVVLKKTNKKDIKRIANIALIISAITLTATMTIVTIVIAFFSTFLLFS